MFVTINFMIRFACLITQQIFADKSTFRGLVKAKAAETVKCRYDFYRDSGGTFYNQQEPINIISTAIKNLMHNSNFLSSGLDEQVSHFNLICHCSH